MLLQIVLAGLLAIGLPVQSYAQSQPAAAPPPAGGAPPPTSAPAVATEQALLNTSQLDALMAPVALYPDPLLAQVLMASTYPLEVIQADRWVAANKKLKGDQLKSAAEKQAWDDSVKSLVATPSVLQMMSKNLEWTQKLGDAVLAQETDVMDAVQRMRSRAYDNKKLGSGTQQTVTVQQEGPRRTIAIAPTTPETIYVPYYDPGVVYGAWPYPANPPYYFPYSGYVATGVIATGLAFGTAYALGRWSTGGYWGGNVNWNNNNININRDRVTHWQHNPQHRHGVRYGNNAVQQRFANTNRPGSDARGDFRGRENRPDRPNAGAGVRPDRGPGDRPDRGSAARPSQRPADRAGRGPATRPGGGQGNRAAAADRARQNRPNAQRPAQQRRPAAQVNRGGGNSAFGNMQPGRAANLQSARGQASFGHGGGGPRMGGGGFHGGGARMGGGGGARMGGGGGRGGGGRGGGGGRRSDINLKDHIVQLGHLDNGLGYYRFAYRGSEKLYVGVMAQEVRNVVPEAVTQGADGYLRVHYELLGLRFQTYGEWKASGARIPAGMTHH
jgi:hypothetical protein